MKLKTIILTLLICLLHLAGKSQSSTFNDSSLCVELSEILPQAEKYFKNKFSLLNETSPDILFLKQYHKKEFLNLARDSVTHKQLLNFINFESKSQVQLDSCCIKNISLVIAADFKRESKIIKNKKGRRIKYRGFYPVIAITKPYFFNGNNLCLIGIDYYSGATSGTFGYYLYEKENGAWRFKDQVFEMMK